MTLGETRQLVYNSGDISCRNMQSGSDVPSGG